VQRQQDVHRRDDVEEEGHEHRCRRAERNAPLFNKSFYFLNGFSRGG